MPQPAQLIRDDHEQMRQQLFRIDRGCSSAEHFKYLVDGLLIDLGAHVRIEQRLFYPAARRLLGRDELPGTSYEEHRQVRTFINELTDLDPEDPRYLEVFAEMRTLLERHMIGAERELLPAVEAAGGDRLHRLAVEMERCWPHYRRDAAEMIRGGIFAPVRALFDQFCHVTWRRASWRPGLLQLAGDAAVPPRRS